MKIKLLLVLPVLTLLAGCFGNTNTKSDDPVPLPSGNFAGQFRAIHQGRTGYHDTVKANLNLSMSATAGFKVTGDTSTVHAGSYGDYSMNSVLVQFIDVSLPKTGTPAKIHLNGYYHYSYDGTVFQLLGIVSDTLVYQYDLKKIN